MLSNDPSMRLDGDKITAALLKQQTGISSSGRLAPGIG
jgi:hypothetical protein